MNGHMMQARALFPGLMASATVAAAATFLSQHYGAPVMLFALLLGMAMNFLSQGGPCLPGIELAAKHLLRLGVALLGLRITLGQIAELGWFPVLLVMGSVIATMAVGLLFAKLAGFKASFGVLTGGSVAICGASAALAISTVLPSHPLRERATLFTVIGVSALSTLAMVVYPLLSQWLGLNNHDAGIFLGATIHDVAQVVGAGYGVSTSTGDTATVVKLMRVAMLMPVIVVIAAVNRKHRSADEPKAVLLPWFVTAFVALMLLGSMDWVPKVVQTGGNELSRWCLVIAISAIGIKTQLQELTTVGFKPILLMLGETIFLAALIASVLSLYSRQHSLF
ncbi:MAG: putative sulfate exporter family transporter [Rhodoferax sp.]|uniref:YeiH family protein n=1 Tax=Rhodoferax sp. TaxID=50421 RepID=UPI00271AA5FA|nr:putative sulfate exporter family transporter [Rhodoferax sp.]MDO8447902.1 putative sulfate exporter family transporter [Rhodoferax sp.]